jgi:hypothetical protein
MPTHSAQRDVEAMLERGAPFEHIESYIECRKDLSEDQKSALWLFAWVEIDVADRRRVVAELAAAL